MSINARISALEAAIADCRRGAVLARQVGRLDLVVHFDRERVGFELNLALARCELI